MFPILVGLVSALSFALLTHLTYGPEGLTDYFWAQAVFWALIASGVLVYAVNRRVVCKVCRLWERLPSVGPFCRGLAYCR